MPKALIWREQYDERQAAFDKTKDLYSEEDFHAKINLGRHKKE